MSSGGATVAVSSNGNVSDPINDPTASVTVAIDNSYESLTGFLDPFFQGRSLDATVIMRVERPLTNLVGPGSELCP